MRIDAANSQQQGGRSLTRKGQDKPMERTI
jgi:hypothetical protein